MKLYLNFERLLNDTEADATRELVKRRGQREPLQHITGATSFCGFEIAVNRHVLVPRPETELLAEAGWEFLGKHPTSNDQRTAVSERRAPSRPVDEANEPKLAEAVLGAPSVLDFGTGSGCIAIALAAKCPGARVTAVDVSADALALARENAARNGVGERIEFLPGDGLGALSAGTRFDLIVSNPPYIPSGEIASLQPEVRDFDPRVALDGGEDGLDFYRRLAAEAGEFLKPGGKLMIEFGDGQADEIKKIFESQKWIVEAVRDDYSQRQRILIARR
ncbi:MAG: peptide chain release factor N(5)-glutamine methyltransferase [Pedosphaera sp.]|nr:peptide chain release factor N(5)-glutamine methyltransferase [Pedosphaera sp.]